MAFVKLAAQSELPATNQAKEFPCGDKLICVANVNGEISAMDNVCLHHGGPLGQGSNRRRQSDLPLARLGV
jgi:nitrite reductase (NADH) small subunit